MITFNPLWETLREKDMNKEDLRKATGLSSSTMAKLSKNESVMLDVVDRICEALNCSVSSVIEITPAQGSNPS